MQIHNNKICLNNVTECYSCLGNDLCDIICNVGQWITLEPEDIIIKEDSYIKSFPLVLEGMLKVCKTNNDNRSILLYHLLPGQVCSVSLTCSMGEMKSNISVIAETKTEIINVPIKYIEKWIDEFSVWKNFMMYSYNHRFDELLETIDNLAFRKMDERLITFFSEIYKTTGEKTFQGKHQDIADALCTSREVISRLLKQLEKDNKILLHRNKIDFSCLM